MAVLNQQTQAELLATIIQTPDDDVPRLVYADFLEDQGEQDRPAFIRAQIELARGSEDDPRRPAFEEQERSLLERNAASWTSELMLKPDKVEYRRGFVEAAGMTAASYLEHGPTMHRFTPLREVSLGGDIDMEQVGELAACPALAQVEKLWIIESGIDDRDAVVLAGSPYLTQLRKLVVWGADLMADGATALVSSLPQLNSLALLNNQLGPRGARALARLPELARLRELYLRGNGIGDAGMRSLAASPHLAVELLSVPENEIGLAGVRAIAKFPHPALRVLDLDENFIGDAAVKALAVSPHLAELTDLHLSGSAIGTSGLRALIASRYLRKLELLDLSGNQLRDRDIAALAEWPGLARLKKFSLGNNLFTYGNPPLADFPYVGDAFRNLQL